MATVFIPTQLKSLTGGIGQIEIDAADVAQVVAQLDARFPGIKQRLCQDDALAPSLQVSIDDKMSSLGLRTKVGPSSEIHFIPAIGGG